MLFAPLFGIFALGLPPQPADSTLERWRHLDGASQRQVLQLARHAFDSYTLNRTEIDPPDQLPEFLQSRTAVFVSAMRNGAPRCCMGTLFPTQPTAAQEIVSNAIAAAGWDRRFRPIAPAELKGLTLIVTIVGLPVPISKAQARRLDPVTEGLAAFAHGRYGVVLSGETARIDRVLKWARIRAGAKDGDRVEYFRIEDVRFIEPFPQRNLG